MPGFVGAPKLPAAQLEHELAATLPVVFDDVLAGHATQEEAPAEAPYEPAGHAVQPVALRPGNVGAPKNPAMQTAHELDERLPVASTDVCAGQGVQATAPARAE